MIRSSKEKKEVTRPPVMEERQRSGMNFSAKEVRQALKELKDKTSADDGIRLPLFQDCCDQTAKNLAPLYYAMG